MLPLSKRPMTNPPASGPAWLGVGPRLVGALIPLQ